MCVIVSITQRCGETTAYLRNLKKEFFQKMAAIGRSRNTLTYPKKARGGQRAGEHEGRNARRDINSRPFSRAGTTHEQVKDENRRRGPDGFVRKKSKVARSTCVGKDRHFYQHI